MSYSMMRTRKRTDRFELRTWTYAYNELRDQGKMAALVPEVPWPRKIILDSKQEVEIRPGDVAIIYPQIGFPDPAPSQLLPADTPLQPPPSRASAEAAVERAEQATAKLKEAAASPPPPPTTVDDIIEPELVIEAEAEMPPPPPRWSGASTLLLTEVKDGESLLLDRDYRSRLVKELREEMDAVTNLELAGAGERAWKHTTASKRREEISAILTELAAIGAALEARGG